MPILCLAGYDGDNACAQKWGAGCKCCNRYQCLVDTPGVFTNQHSALVRWATKDGHSQPRDVKFDANGWGTSVYVSRDSILAFMSQRCTIDEANLHSDIERFIDESCSWTGCDKTRTYSVQVVSNWEEGDRCVGKCSAVGGESDGVLLDTTGLWSDPKSTCIFKVAGSFPNENVGMALWKVMQQALLLHQAGQQGIGNLKWECSRQLSITTQNSCRCSGGTVEMAAVTMLWQVDGWLWNLTVQPRR